MRSGRLGPLLALVMTGPLGWGLEVEIDTQVSQTQAAVSGNQPGGPLQQVSVADTLTQATVSHRKALTEGLSAEGTYYLTIDTLPSGTPQSLPADKLDFSSRFLEAWLGWELVPGTLTLGAGKQVIHPSSGFSHAPLDFAYRGGPTTGAQAISDWEEGWMGAKASWFLSNVSVSAFWAPALSWDDSTDQVLKYLTSPQPGGFAQGQIGLTLGSTDLRGLVFQGSGPTRAGLGVDSGWGEAWIFRAEAAASANPEAWHSDLMVGATWAGTDQTVMVELAWDDTGSSPVPTGFVRWAGKLDKALDADAWVKADLSDASGWLGSSLTWTADKWSLSGQWLGAWGGPTTDAGSSALLWKPTVEAKVFL